MSFTAYEFRGCPDSRTWRRFRARSGVSAILLAMSCIPSGCSARPAASAGEVYGYFRNAAFGANVARLDEDAQGYVEGVMKAFNAWKRAAEPVRTLFDSESLPGQDSDEWRSGAALAQLAPPALAWVADEARTPAEDKPDDPHPTVTLLWNRLNKAIAQLPPGLSDVQADRVRETLNLKERREECDALAAGCHRLATLVTQFAGHFKQGAKGLTFDDAAVTSQVRKEWQDLHDLLKARENAHRSRLQALVDQGKAIKEKTLAEKKDVLAAAPISDVQRQRLREIKADMDYYDVAIPNAANQLRALDVKEKAAEAAKAKAKSGEASSEPSGN